MTAERVGGIELERAVGPTGEHPVIQRPARTIYQQRVESAAFLHWSIDPERVASMCPAGTWPDTLDGRTYVGVVALARCRAGVLGGPSLPYPGTFGQLNIRIYTTDAAGHRAVVFRALHVPRLATAGIGRLAGLPFVWSRVLAGRRRTDRAYLARPWRWRRGQRPTCRVAVRPGDLVREPSAVERFVTERDGLHFDVRGQTLYWPNTHPEWTLHRADLLALDDGLMEPAGLPAVTTPPESVLWSPGVPMRFGRPTRVGGRHRALRAASPVRLFGRATMPNLAA